MKKRKIRDFLQLISAILFSWIYIPHMLIYLTHGGVRADVVSIRRQIELKGIPTFLSFLYLLHNNRYFRTLFYFRIGPIASAIIGWWRPGDRYFKIAKSLDLGGGVLFAHPYATILNARHIGKNFNFRHCTTLGHNNRGCPYIGDNVYLGANVTIIGPVTVGNNVIVGAGSVVVKDVPDNCVIAGNPAKIIRYIS